MITVTSLRFSDEKSNFILQEDFYSLLFDNEDLANTFISNRKAHWEGVLLMKLTISPNFNETLRIIEIKKVFRFVARKMNLSTDAMLGKTRKRENVEARRYAIMICRNRNMTYQMIADQIGLDRTTIMHHENVMRGLMDAYTEVFNKFYEIEDYVLIQINGEYADDGSGTKIK